LLACCEIKTPLRLSTEKRSVVNLFVNPTNFFLQEKSHNLLREMFNEKILWRLIIKFNSSLKREVLLFIFLWQIFTLYIHSIFSLFMSKYNFISKRHGVHILIRILFLFFDSPFCRKVQEALHSHDHNGGKFAYISPDSSIIGPVLEE